MNWTPALGTQALVDRLGRAEALDALLPLLTGDASGRDLLDDGPFETLLDIGDGHAARLMDDPTGARLAYWPRVWAARSMAYLGDVAAAPWLVHAVSDEHWRVRMTAVQTIGRLGVHGTTTDLVAALADGHPRVRAAAVVALGRVGDERAVEPLAVLSTAAASRAIARIERREVR